MDTLIGSSRKAKNLTVQGKEPNRCICMVIINRILWRESNLCLYLDLNKEDLAYYMYSHRIDDSMYDHSW